METQLPTPNPCQWVLHNDEDVLVINKPSGVLSVRDGYKPDLPFIASLLEPFYGKIWMVHRLDKETSGIMVMALNPESHKDLNEQFRSRQIEKVYHCLAFPTPEWQELSMNAPLKVNADREHRTRVDIESGKPALTTAVVRQTYVQIALLECQIFTGFTHQIRAHLYHHGIGILGDALYRPPSIRQSSLLFQVARTMLHAWQLGFSHPRTKQEIKLIAPYPTDFSDLLDQLQIHNVG